MPLTRAAAAAEPWRLNLVTDPAAVRALALAARVVAVLGIKTEAQADAPAHHVPAYLQKKGVRVVPVPVYFPATTHILGEAVHRSCASAAAAAGPLDVVCVFRRPQDVPAHAADVLAARPACVWLQQGIACDEAAEAWARAGLRVVQDRCLLVEHAAAARDAART
jgi:predicted CoA-binding protein